tara:strand:- start:122 stop:658 length:537 start_codon:yes stop_codon:yes gene_type:complete
MAFDITQANWGREETQPKVVQVVNIALQEGVTTTSNTFVDSPLSAAITPIYTDSKIKISYHVIGGSSNGVGVPLRIKRDIGGTTAFNILTAASDGSQPAGEATTYYTGYGASGYVGFHQGIECLDTPNTTNEVKYIIQFCEAYSSQSAAYINQVSTSFTAQNYSYNSCSSITLEEIVQ